MSDFKPLIFKLIKISLIIIASIGLVYIGLKLTLFPSNPLKNLFGFIYNGYLIIPEWLANQVFNLTGAGVSIDNHTLLFENITQYQTNYTAFLTNWPKFLLYRNLSLLTLLLIWLTTAPIRKKIIFSFVFFLAHIVSVVAGLYLLGVIGPQVFEAKQKLSISPTFFGTLIIYSLCVIWILLNKSGIRSTIQKLPFKFDIPDKTVYEVLVLVFIFILLRSFFIPFFDYQPYVIVLLKITNEASSWFGHTGSIEGDQLVGASGALALSKHCLGFMTMFVFAAFTFLTRIKNNKVNWIYILSGIIFLFIVNIVRLAAVFIVAQGENGFHRASIHHEMYNMAIYVSIFILWVIWLEFFVWKKQRRKSKL